MKFILFWKLLTRNVYPNKAKQYISIGRMEKVEIDLNSFHQHLLRMLLKLYGNTQWTPRGKHLCVFIAVSVKTPYKTSVCNTINCRGSTFVL